MVYKGNLGKDYFLKRTFEPEGIGNPAPSWFWSYVSMALLVLAFFVALVSMTAVQKKEQLVEVQKKIGGIKETTEEKRVTPVAEEKPKLAEGISTRIDREKGLIVSLREKILFETGKADLSPEAKTVLDGLYPIFLKIPNEIVVEGHTDNVPISTPQFPSNWELSTARATEVVRYLIEEKKFPDERIAATGYGEYHPVADNSTPEGRSQNRRVDFVIRPLK